VREPSGIVGSSAVCTGRGEKEREKIRSAS
jgi:hypothetical protein